MLDWPSIQPWHRASSTASSRFSDVGSLVSFLARVRDTPFEVEPFSVSQRAHAVAFGTVSLSSGFIAVETALY